jgi:hypothetical protein
MTNVEYSNYIVDQTIDVFREEEIITNGGTTINELKNKPVKNSKK